MRLNNEVVIVGVAIGSGRDKDVFRGTWNGMEVAVLGSEGSSVGFDQVADLLGLGGVGQHNTGVHHLSGGIITACSAEHEVDGR